MDEKTDRRFAFMINAAYIMILTTLTVKYLVPWLVPFIAGYAIATAVRPAVSFIAGHTGMEIRAVGIGALISVYLSVAALLFLGGSKLVGVIGAVISDFPAFYTETIIPAVTALSQLLERSLTVFFPGAALDLASQNLQDHLFSLSSSMAASFGAVTIRVPAVMLAFFFTIMSSFIISVNYPEITGFIIRQIPEKRRPLLLDVKNGALSATRNYLLAYLKIMGATFLLLTAGFAALRVENCIPIALGIAVFDALPVLGVGGIIIPWAVISMLNMRFAFAVGLLSLYIINVCARGIIEPRIVGRQLGLHPLATLCAIYVGFRLAGVMGMIAAPIAAQILAGLRRSGAVKLWN